MRDDIFEYVKMKPIWKIGASVQIATVACLYVLTTLGCYFQVQSTGKMYGYSPGVSMLFVPIYEELIFRGVLLQAFERLYRPVVAVLVVSILFALWHLKNILWLEPSAILHQMAYTGLIFSPITCWITLRTRSIWPAVVIHYLNNFPLDGWIYFFNTHVLGVR